MSSVRLVLRAARRASAFSVALVVAVLLCAAAPARADYRLHVGDVIEISVARAPELKQRVPVQLDGSISFPMLGNLPVAGLTPAEAQSRIQAILATKIFRQRISDGRENEIMIDHDEVTATVVEYRPVYVNGDVAKPGEYAYRPLMSVRQAIALSGGYELVRYRMQNPILEAADLRAEYETLWAEFAREQAHVWRLKTELGETGNSPDRASLKDLPLSPSAVSEIVHVEAEQLKASQADYDRQKVYLQQAIALGQNQIGVLTEQQKQDDEGAQADLDELQRAMEFYGKGALPSPRVADSRRAVLMSSTRKLQTSAQLMQIKQQQDDFTRQLGKLDDQRRMDLLRELQETNLKLAGVRAKLQSTSEKLQYATVVRSQFVQGGSQPEIVVIRMDEKNQTRIRASEETELQPGDVVEVTLRPGQPGDQSRQPAPAMR